MFPSLSRAWDRNDLSSWTRAKRALLWMLILSESGRAVSNHSLNESKFFSVFILLSSRK